MNVSKVLTKNYENKRPRSRGENKPNSNPILSPNCESQAITQWLSDLDIASQIIVGLVSLKVGD